MPLEDIPSFLKLPQAERDAAWNKHRLAQKALPAVSVPPPVRIPTPPGAKDADTDA